MAAAEPLALFRDALTYFIYSFTSIFAIVNPFSTLIAFLSLTGGARKKQKERTARRAVKVALGIAVIFAITGELILRLFGITADNLRVAGGVLLFIVALDMLRGGEQKEERAVREEVGPSAKGKDITVFPLAIPMMTGPGAITTVILLMRTANGLLLKVVSLVAIVAVFVVTYVMLRSADRINKFIGVTLSMVITRLMGLIIAAIAVNFVTVGIWNIFHAMK